MNQIALEAWNTRGALAHGAAEILAGSENPTLQARARRLTSCASFLRVSAYGRLSPAYACGDPICPCCGGRRDRISHKYIDGLPNVLAAHDGDMVSACFTVQNVAAGNLRLETKRINTTFTDHFLRCLKYQLKAAPSYIKKVEVTRADDGDAHPHIHAMLALPRGWTDAHSLLGMWQRAGKLRYTPDVYSRNVPPAEAARELRYILKQLIRVDPEMLNDPGFILAAATGMSGVRTTSAGGLFRRCAVSRANRPVTHRTLDLARLEWTGNGYQPFEAALAA
jgi:hypothetical protein